MPARRNLNYYIKSIAPEITYPLIIQYLYLRRMGHKCNLKNPRRFSEKIQWAKLYRNHEMLSLLTDKIEARKWVADTIGENYLIPTIGNSYNDVNDIPFDDLPESFVIKANHGSGFNLVVDNKNSINWNEEKQVLNAYLKTKFAYVTMEMHYKDIRPMLYIEQKIGCNEQDELADYKFFCFNGKVFCLYVILGTNADGCKRKLGIFDREFNLLSYRRTGYEPIVDAKKPANFEKMIEIAEKLSHGFSHVRVDLYNVGGKIYFGEMTFTTNGGFSKFVPDEFDYILGDQWDLKSGI